MLLYLLLKTRQETAKLINSSREVEKKVFKNPAELQATESKPRPLCLGFCARQNSPDGKCPLIGQECLNYSELSKVRFDWLKSLG